MADSLTRVLQSIVNATTLGRKGTQTRVVTRFTNAAETVTVSETTTSEDISNDTWGPSANPARWGEFIWD